MEGKDGHSTSFTIASWIGKALVVIVPAITSSYFSYRTAKVEAEVQTKSTENKAEAGYQTLVDAVKKLEIATLEEQKAVARIEGRILAVENRLNGHATHSPAPTSTPTRTRASGSGSIGTASSPPRPALPAPTVRAKAIFLPLPRTLNEAAQMKK